jgi:hypothetical protein
MPRSKRAKKLQQSNRANRAIRDLIDQDEWLHRKVSDGQLRVDNAADGAETPGPCCVICQHEIADRHDCYATEMVESPFILRVDQLWGCDDVPMSWSPYSLPRGIFMCSECFEAAQHFGFVSFTVWDPKPFVCRYSGLPGKFWEDKQVFAGVGLEEKYRAKIPALPVPDCNPAQVYEWVARFFEGLALK